MPELRLAGIHDDGENLILESADGTTYLLPIDQNLRQSIARARRINPLRGGNSGSFGPREIQTRFRQGATVEEIAAESGWEPNRVRRYEWPIVAERANIIHTARTAVISPAPGQGDSAQSLDQHIEEVAERFNFADAPMNWSTWQQESGQWTVSLDITLTDELLRELPRTVMFPARWNFNPANQSIYASNEAAYFLMGRDHSHDSPIPGLAPSASQVADEGSPAEAQKEASAQSIQVAPPKVSAVRVPQRKEHHELLEELASRRGVRSFDPASERKLADLLERARRGSQPAGELRDIPPVVRVPSSDSETDFSSSSSANPDSQTDNQQPESSQDPHEDKDKADSSAVNDGENGENSLPADQSSVAHEGLAVIGSKKEPGLDSDLSSLEQAEAVDSHEADANKNDSDAKGKQARGKRTSVPSWDDIIFGNQRR